MSEMNERQKKETMALITKKLRSFNLSEEEYLKKVKEIHNLLYGKGEKKNE